MEDRVRHRRVLGLERLENQQEPCTARQREQGTGERGLARPRDAPFSYVATSVAKLATFCSAAYSSIRLSSSVLTSDCRRSAQNLPPR